MKSASDQLEKETCCVPCDEDNKHVHEDKNETFIQLDELNDHLEQLHNFGISEQDPVKRSLHIIATREDIPEQSFGLNAEFDTS